MTPSNDKRLPTDRNTWWANKWLLPLFSVTLGLIMLAASWAGGHPRQGAYMFGVMALFGAVLLLGGRSETIRAYRGDGRDERWAMIDLKATAMAGLAVMTAIIIGFIVEIANGRNGSPYVVLGAIAGIAYIVAFFVERWRS